MSIKDVVKQKLRFSAIRLRFYQGSYVDKKTFRIRFFGSKSFNAHELSIHFLGSQVKRDRWFQIRESKYGRSLMIGRVLIIWTLI